MRLRESLPPRDRKSFNTTAKMLFDSEAFTVAFYHRRGRPPPSTGDALGIDLFARACMKTCDQPDGQGPSRIRLNWQGDSRAKGYVTVPAAVSVLPFRKGFLQ